MNYERDYLNRLIITEELDTSVLDKLKKITGVSGNIKVVLSKSAEKEINTIKNANMNNASRGLIVSALANDTVSSISKGIKKYGFKIQNAINEDTTSEQVIVIDYAASLLNNGLRAEGLIFECLCVNHFNNTESKINSELNDIFGKSKNSISDFKLSVGGKDADVQCKWSAQGDGHWTTNFGKPTDKINISDNNPYIIMSGNNTKCILFEANEEAKQEIREFCRCYVNNTDNSKRNKTWFLNKDVENNFSINNTSGNVTGIKIINNNLNIDIVFWNGKKKTDGFLYQPNFKKIIKGSKDGTFTFTIDKDINKFIEIKNEVFSDFKESTGKESKISKELDIRAQHMKNPNKKSKKIASDDDIEKYVNNENKKPVDKLQRREFRKYAVGKIKTEIDIDDIIKNDNDPRLKNKKESFKKYLDDKISLKYSNLKNVNKSLKVNKDMYSFNKALGKDEPKKDEIYNLESYYNKVKENFLNLKKNQPIEESYFNY